MSVETITVEQMRGGRRRRASAPARPPTPAQPGGPATTTDSADQRLGIAWWNGLSEGDRAGWLREAGSARPADAWAAFKTAQK